MSRIKQLTREVVREGEDRRATFTAQGAPLRIYKWWHRHTKRQVTKENFCHYCRVVAIWAPLMFIRMLFAKLFRDRQFWICMSIAVAVIVIGTSIAYPGGMGVAMLGLIAFLIAAAGFIAGCAFADYVKDKSTFNDTHKIVKAVAVPLMVLTLPVAVAGFILGVTANILISKKAKRFYRWMGETRLVNDRVSPFGALLLIVVGAVIVLSIIGDWWIVPLAIGALVTVILVGRWSAEKLGYYLARRREADRKRIELAERRQSLATLEPVFRTIFGHLYPAHREEDGMYWSWYARYIERAEQRRSVNVWSDICRNSSPYDFPDWDDWNESLFMNVEEQLQLLHQQKWQAKQRTEQQRREIVRKATLPVTVFGDFIILLAQFIRVSKWKICPVVELPKDL